MNEFRKDLRWSGSPDYQDWLLPLYRKAFPSYVRILPVLGRCPEQAAGVDKWVELPGGKRLAIEEKQRRNQKPDDIALEFEHFTITKGDSWPGWIEKPNQLTDYLVMCFKEYKTAFFLPYSTLQKTWVMHKEDWKLKYAKQAPNLKSNPPYITRFCAVPTDILMGLVPDAMRMTA